MSSHENDHEYRTDTRLHLNADDLKDEEHATTLDNPQPADEPRGEDEVRRELGPGDGDDPPPDEDDEPLSR